MCGICGEVAFKGSADGGAVHRMMDAMQARGPDAAGQTAFGRVSLGHRRLSIIDLAATSEQPMSDPHLGLTIVFNGCIYNYRDLRAELENKGYHFFSQGDTEVILKAYHAWGPRCVERFFGMFAFAIAERDSGRVFFARDRLGIKPLYYTRTNEHFRFASTLPALLAAGGVSRELDPAGVHFYMSLHAVVPAPRTILRDVKKLPPATYAFLEADGTTSETTYWDVTVGAADARDASRSASDWREEVLATFTRAVKRRQIADVPTGVLLSGGLDSSLIVALLAREGQRGLKTYSVGFESVNGIEGDEFVYSDLVARRFETDHTRIRVDADETLGALPGAIAAMSEPMMSHDSVGFYLLSREVSKHVKVVQSGQGADEVFGGYHWYPKMLDARDAVATYADVYFDRHHDEMRSTLDDSWISQDYSRDYVADYFARSKAERPVDEVLELDTKIMLVDDPVKRVDNMTMAYGIEARVPFLDHEIVELAARMPAELKLADGGKGILKAAARGVVPDEVIDRPKGYFPVPALKHIRGPYLDYVRDVLGSERARTRGLFKRDYVERLLADPDGTLTPKGHSKLWQISLLELWLQSHGL